MAESHDLATAIAATHAYKADVRARIERMEEVADLEILLANSFPPCPSRPPINAEYLLHLVLRKEEREAVIGDLVQEYGCVMQRS